MQSLHALPPHAAHLTPQLVTHPSHPPHHAPLPPHLPYPNLPQPTSPHPTHPRDSGLPPEFMYANPAGVSWGCDDDCGASTVGGVGGGDASPASSSGATDAESLQFYRCMTCAGFPEGHPECLGVTFMQTFQTIPHAMVCPPLSHARHSHVRHSFFPRHSLPFFSHSPTLPPQSQITPHSGSSS